MKIRVVLKDNSELEKDVEQQELIHALEDMDNQRMYIYFNGSPLERRSIKEIILMK
jgi:hypothetical protein